MIFISLYKEGWNFCSFYKERTVEILDFDPPKIFTVGCDDCLDI